MSIYKAENLDDFVKKAYFDIENTIEFSGIYVPKDSIEYLDDEDQWGNRIKNVYFDTVDENGNPVKLSHRQEIDIRNQLLEMNEPSIDYDYEQDMKRDREEERARQRQNPDNRLNIR